jgi:hypothetical protein
MEERGNKTIMCSVFFLDIVEYSKKSVAGQISLKDRFNSYLSAAIRDVPMTDRIILDTGDGAAINFLGDVEDALKAALSLRESLLAEDPNVDHPLLVRMGINLGPVRLVRDINGQPNIVGDGINVAQRVMGFADPAQILVSRSYYDAVSRLSPQYAGMFHYQGSRTDKHVREHEVYAIGYPGDKTTHRGTIRPEIAGQAESSFARLVARAKADWYATVTILDTMIANLIARFQQSGSMLRALYIGIVAVPLLLLIALLVKLGRHDAVPVAPTALDKQAVNMIQPGSAVVSVASVRAGSDVKAQAATPAHTPTTSKPRTKKVAERKKATDKHSIKDKHPKDQPNTKTLDVAEKSAAIAASSDGLDAHVIVSCREGAEVFIDSARKGRIGSKPLNIAVAPGQHTVIVSHTSGGIYKQNVELNSGKTVHIKPSFCD